MPIYIRNWIKDITKLIFFAANNANHELISSWKANSRLSNQDFSFFMGPPYSPRYSQVFARDSLKYLVTGWLLQCGNVTTRSTTLLEDQLLLSVCNCLCRICGPFVEAVSSIATWDSSFVVTGFHVTYTMLTCWEKMWLSDWTTLWRALLSAKNNEIFGPVI